MVKAENYYDIPSKWIPSANFAGRPLCEISESNFVDGSSTLLHIDVSPFDTREDSLQHLPDPIQPAQPEPRALVAPSVMATTPTDDMMTKSLASEGEAAERPTVGQNAATAPPGGISTYKPQPPRRAISARMGSSITTKRLKPREQSVVEDPIPLDKGSADGEFSTTQQLVPPTKPPRPDDDYLTQDAKQTGSFSQKARVKRTLQDKNVARLKTDIVDFEMKGLLSSPTSMMSTPRELYAIPEQKSETNSIHSRQSETVGTTRSKNSSTSAQTDGPDWVEHKVYLSGPIGLEEHPAKLRRDSLDSLDPFEKSTEPRGKRFSDIIGIEKIVMYFEGLGVLEEGTNACLDQYWLDESPPTPHVADARQAGATNIEELGAASLEKGSASSSPPGSRFSFSSASSTAS